jgi:thioredoxin 1
MSAEVISDDSFFEEVLSSREAVLVAFRSSACAESLDLAPRVDRIAARFAGRIKVVSVDVDRDSAAVVGRYGVHRLPVTMMFADGQVTDVVGGLAGEDTLAEMVERHLDPIVGVDERNFDRVVKASIRPTLVMFCAEWCLPSQEVEERVRRLSADHRGQVNFARVELDQGTRQLCAQYGVWRVPTTALFSDGVLKDRIDGLASRETITSMLEHYVL